MQELKMDNVYEVDVEDFELCTKRWDDTVVQESISSNRAKQY